MLNKKSRFKPLYKQFNKLKENALNSKKILNFKSNKWKPLINQYYKKLKWFNKYKTIDQLKYRLPQYPSRGRSFKKQYRDTINASRCLRLYYGYLSKHYLKTTIKHILKRHEISSDLVLLLINSLEQRLDTTIFQAKFCISIRMARQLIIHKKVFVNKRLVQSPSYKLSTGDVISIDTTCIPFIKKNLEKINKPILPQKHLFINYRTAEIIFQKKITKTNIPKFPYYFNLERILTNYKKFKYIL